jgi:hypothetical protein
MIEKRGRLRLRMRTGKRTPSCDRLATRGYCRVDHLHDLMP